MYIDAEKLIAEIKRYKNKADERLKIKGRTFSEEQKDLALQNLCGNLLHFITLQQEPHFPQYNNIVDKVFGAGNLESWEYREAEMLVALAKEELLKSLQQEQPEVDLEKFTEKMNAWKARYNHPDNIPIKATMAFTARMFYQYPNVARQWYEQLPKATMD